MNLFLYNQKRNRDLNEYLTYLNITNDEFKKINTYFTKIMIIGGGLSVIQKHFLNDTYMHITNIDLDPSLINTTSRIKNLKGDFLIIDLKKNYYDEVWALYSLPLYASNSYAVYLFMYKSILSLRPGGVLRFFPLEFVKESKLHTKDADYDMETMECTQVVIDVVEQLQKIGIMVDMIDWPEVKKGRLEKTVILKLPKSCFKKAKIDKIILELIKNRTGYKPVRYFLTPEEIDL